MNLHWSASVILPVPSGRLHVVTGYVECEPGGGFNGELVADQGRREMMRVAGIDRAAWGDLSFLYARHCMGQVDVLMVSVAVIVGEGKPGKETT